MNSTNRTAYQQLRPGIILGLCILFGLMILAGPNKVSQLFLQYEWKYFGYAVLLALLNQFFRFLKRHYCLDRGGVGKISIGRSFQLFVAGFPLAITPMKVGESFKGIWLNRFSGLPVEKAVSVFLVDHISDGLSVFLLTCFGTIAYPTLWPYFSLVLVLFLCSLIFLQVKPMARVLLNISEKLPFAERLVPELRKCVEGYPELFRISSLTVSSLLGLASWMASGAALVAILLGFGFAFSWQLVGISLFVFAFSMLMGILSAFPGGVGVMEVAMAALLTIFFGFSPAYASLGGKPEYAAAATILFRVATFWVSFILGVLTWNFSGKNLGIQSEEGHIIDS